MKIYQIKSQIESSDAVRPVCIYFVHIMQRMHNEKHVYKIIVDVYCTCETEFVRMNNNLIIGTKDFVRKLKFSNVPVIHGLFVQFQTTDFSNKL
jgi:hypothetical protein